MALVFAFGLLHGLGFAGGLTDLDLSGGELAGALVGFNLGVEAGQLAVAFVALPLLGLVSERPWFRARVQAPMAIGIGLAGAYWVVERTLLT